MSSTMKNLLILCLLLYSAYMTGKVTFDAGFDAGAQAGYAQGAQRGYEQGKQETCHTSRQT